MVSSNGPRNERQQHPVQVHRVKKPPKGRNDLHQTAKASPWAGGGTKAVVIQTVKDLFERHRQRQLRKIPCG